MILRKSFQKTISSIWNGSVPTSNSRIGQCDSNNGIGARERQANEVCMLMRKRNKELE